MTLLSAGILLAQLLTKGPALLGAAKELATLIISANEEERDLTPDEVRPYVEKGRDMIAKMQERLD